MKKYSKLFKRAQAMILVVAMLLSMSNLGLFFAASATGSATNADKTDGEIVADNYDLTAEEKELLKSGYLVGEVHEYTKPESSSLISVDIDNKKIAAQEYNGGSGYDWIPVSADIVVNSEVKETVALTDGKGTYAYTGDAFSVKVDYELRIDVAIDLQKDLLGAPAWLKQGVENLDVVFGNTATANLGTITEALDVLQDIAEGVFISMGGLSIHQQFEEDAQNAVAALVNQYNSNGGKLDLVLMGEEYQASSSKVQYLLSNTDVRMALVETYDCLSAISKDAMMTSTAVIQILEQTNSSGAVAFKAFKSILNGWLTAMEPVYNDPWTATTKDLVKDTGVDYVKLDELVADLKTTEGQDVEVTNTSLLADTATVQYNMSMYDVTVKLVYKTANTVTGMTNLIEVAVDDSNVLTFEKGTEKVLIAADADLVAQDWIKKQNGYLADKYEVSYSELPDTLTEDVTYVITYSPKYYTLDNLGEETDVPYGYKMKLEAHADITQAYDYYVNGDYYAQNSTITITGDTTITREVGKSYASSSLSQAVADWYYGDQPTASGILTSGALTVGNEQIAVRYPDNNGNIVKIVDGKLTAKPYPSSYNGLYWVPYTYTVVKGGNSTLYYFQGAETVTVESGYSSVSVEYYLALTNFDKSLVEDVMNLPALLIGEAETQINTLNRLSSYTDTIGQLDKTKLGALNGVISVADLHSDPQKNEELRAYFSGIVGSIINDCLDGNNLRIYTILKAYQNGGLGYYYRNSQIVIDEIDVLSGYLSDMLADDEKVAALEVLVGDAGFPEYAEKIKDLEKVMADVKAALTAPNAAIDLNSSSANKLINLLETAVKNNTVINDVAYGDGLHMLANDSINLVASGVKLITLKVNVPGKIVPAISAFNFSVDHELNQQDVDAMIQAIKDAIAQIPGFDADYYNVVNYAAELKTLVGKKVEELAKYDYVYTYETKKATIRVEGMADQTIDIDSLLIDLALSPDATYRYDYVINGVAYSFETYDFGKNFTTAQLKALLNSGLLVIERNEVNVAREKLLTMVNNLNKAVGNDIITFVLIENGSEYSIVMKINATDDPAAVPGALQSAVMALATESGYSYIGMNGNGVVYLNEENSLEISLQAVIDAITTSGFGTDTLLNMMDSKGNVNHLPLSGTVISDKKVTALGGELIETTMELGDNAKNAMAIAFHITMGTVSTEMLQMRNLFDEQLDKYLSFTMSNGKANLSLTMPELAYEAYLAALLITGNVDIEDINSVNAEIAIGFIQDFMDPAFSGDVTVNTLTNTMNMFGYDVDLSKYDKLYNKLCEQYATIELEYDKTSGEITRRISIKELLGAVEGLGDLAQMIKEYETGITMTAKASLTNLGTEYEALYVDVRAEGATNKLGLTTDLAAKLENLSGVSVVVLMSDITGDLVFDKTTVLNLNGFTVNGNIVSTGNLTIVDSSLDKEHTGAVTGSISGNVLITGGHFNADVSGFLKSGYLQENGIVSNHFYSFVKDNEGNLTIELDAGMFLLYADEIPSAKAMLIDLAFDMLFNGYTTNKLEIEGSKVYEIALNDFVGIYTGEDRLATLADQVMNMIDPSALAALAKTIVRDLADFGKIENAILNDMPIVSYDMVTASWNVALQHIKEGDYLSAGITSGADENRKLMIKIVGSDEDKQRLADAMGILDDTTDVDVSISLNPTINTTNKDVTLEFTASASVVIDLSKNPNFAIVFSILAADGISGSAKDALIAGVKTYYETNNIADLKKAFNALTTAQVITAVKNLNRGDQFSTMVAKLGLEDEVAADLIALEDIFDNYAKLVAAVLRRTEFTGGGRTLGSFYDNGYDVYRENLNKVFERDLFKGYTAILDMTITKLNISIELFGDVVVEDELDYTELQEQIDEANKLNGDNYTPKTWADVESALAAANALMNNATTQDEIDTAAKNLKDAIAALKNKPSYMKLFALMNQIDSANLNEGDYTTDSWAAFKAAYDAADKMVTELSAETQAEVDAVESALRTAWNKLEEKPVEPVLDYAVLEDAINQVPADGSIYTEETWAEVEAALAAANALMNNATTQDEINTAAQNLLDAIEALEKKPVAPVLDYTVLNNAINQVPADGSIYTEETWAEVEAALVAANALMNNATTQDEIETAAQNLLDAIEALEKKPTPPALNYGELDALIKEAEAVIAEGTCGEHHYTQASIDKLVPVYNDIIARYDTVITQDDIDTLADTLRAALDDLDVLYAPTLGQITAGTHAQLRGETVITDDRMTLNVKADGISAEDYKALLNFNVEGEYDSIEITVEDKNGLVYTGAKVTVVATNRAGTVEETYTVVVMGDNNGSGDIDVLDIVQLCEHLGKVDALNGIYADAIDLLADEDIDIRDLVHLCQLIAEQ